MGRWLAMINHTPAKNKSRNRGWLIGELDKQGLLTKVVKQPEKYTGCYHATRENHHRSVVVSNRVMMVVLSAARVTMVLGGRRWRLTDGDILALIPCFKRNGISVQGLNITITQYIVREYKWRRWIYPHRLKLKHTTPKTPNQIDTQPLYGLFVIDQGGKVNFPL